MDAMAVMINTQLDAYEKAIDDELEAMDLDAEFDGGEFSGTSHVRRIEAVEVKMNELHEASHHYDRECEECGTVLTYKDWPKGTSCPICYPFDSIMDEEAEEE